MLAFGVGGFDHAVGVEQEYVAIFQASALLFGRVGDVFRGADPGAERGDAFTAPGGRAQDDQIFMRPGEHELAVGEVANQSQRGVFVLAQTVAHVVVQHCVHDFEQRSGGRIEVFTTERRDDALQHHHHQARA